MTSHITHPTRLMIPGLTDRSVDAEAIRSILAAHPAPWCAATPPNNSLRTENPILTCCCKAVHGTSEGHENALGETWGTVLRGIDRVPEAVRPW